MGQRLLALRTQRGYSQRELAGLAGVANSALSQIEQGKISPSITTLEKILKAIPISLLEFFADKINLPSSIRKGDNLLKIQQEGVEYRVFPILEPRLPKHYLASQRYLPGAEVTSDWMFHKGSVSGMLVEGNIDLYLEGVRYTLQVGDCFHFLSNRPHRFLNNSDQDCIIVAVTLEMMED